jgi:hypothetical protein
VTVATQTRPPRRAMKCGRCEAEWSVPVGERPGAAVHCPYCEAHICGCGADLSEYRADAVFRSEAHSKKLKRLASADIAPKKTVAEARALQEDAKAHWSMVVDEAIVRHFRRDPGGTFHADDLESLGIPDDHRNVIGSQIAKWVNRKRMVECGRRASTVPSRNGAKSNEYRLTKTGVDLVIAGPDSENAEGITPAGTGALDRPEGSKALLPPSHGAASTIAVGSGESAASGRYCVPAERPGASGGNPVTDAAPDPDLSPRSSSEEQRSSNPQVSGSNPDGGTQQRRAADVRSAHGSEANPLGEALIADDRPEGMGTGPDVEPGDKTEVPAVAADLHHGHLPATSPYSVENDWS